MSDDEKKPEGIPAGAIEMTVRRVVCQVHGEPYRAQWPLGYAITMVKLFEAVMGPKAPPERNAAVWSDARAVLGLPPDSTEALPGKAMEAALDRKALCCRVTPEEMRRVYEASGIGKRARCTICRTRAMGTPCNTAQGPIEHLCFTCVIRQVERHAKMH